MDLCCPLARVTRESAAKQRCSFIIESIRYTKECGDRSLLERSPKQTSDGTSRMVSIWTAGVGQISNFVKRFSTNLYKHLYIVIQLTLKMFNYFCCNAITQLSSRTCSNIRRNRTNDFQIYKKNDEQKFNMTFHLPFVIAP